MSKPLQQILDELNQDVKRLQELVNSDPWDLLGSKPVATVEYIWLKDNVHKLWIPL